MNEVVVIGIGNRLMMDDGIGVVIIEELQRRNTNSSIRYVVGETDINYCIGQIAEGSNIVIVDAAQLGKRPGDISIISFEDLTGIKAPLFSLHEAHFLSEIILTDKNIHGILIAVETVEIDYGLGLSIILQERFSSIIDSVGYAICDLL